MVGLKSVQRVEWQCKQCKQIEIRFGFELELLRLCAEGLELLKDSQRRIATLGVSIV
jgi:hypothetical protein